MAHIHVSGQKDRLHAENGRQNRGAYLLTIKEGFDLSERIIWAVSNSMITSIRHTKKQQKTKQKQNKKQNSYCRIHQRWIWQSVLNVHDVIVMAVTKTYLHCFITTLRWLLHIDALHQASACAVRSIPISTLNLVTAGVKIFSSGGFLYENIQLLESTKI